MPRELRRLAGLTSCVRSATMVASVRLGVGPQSPSRLEHEGRCNATSQNRKVSLKGVGGNSVATCQEAAGAEREAAMQPKRHLIFLPTGQQTSPTLRAFASWTAGIGTRLCCLEAAKLELEAGRSRDVRGLVKGRICILSLPLPSKPADCVLEKKAGFCDGFVPLRLASRFRTTCCTRRLHFARNLPLAEDGGDPGRPARASHRDARCVTGPGNGQRAV